MARLLRATEIWRRYGLKAALSFSASVASCRKGQMFSTRLPGLPYPIWLRSGSSDVSVFFQVFVRDEYDFDGFAQGQWIGDRYETILAQGEIPLIVDCGANIGLSTVWLAHRFPRAKVIAIEPSSESVTLLRRNVAPYSNVEVMEGAVWDTAARLAVVNPADPPWAHRVDVSDFGMPAYTLNKLSADLPLLIVKIDIEGAEHALFRSNTEWIDKTDLIIIEPHDWLFPGRQTSANLFGTIDSGEMEICIKGENLFIFRAARGTSSRDQRGAD